MMGIKINTQRRQQGASMLLALIALLILSVSAVALIRSVDSGTLIIGNLGFKRDATQSGAIGAQNAMAWLESNQGALDADIANRGYYASSLETLDPTGSNTSATNKLELIDWDGTGNCSDAKAGTYASCTRQPFPLAADAGGAALVNGNTVQWIITRLCKSAGDTNSPNTCLKPQVAVAATASDRGEITAGGRISDSVAGPYYRIIVRSAGPRRTVSYTETIVHF